MENATTNFDELAARVEQSMQADRFHLRRSLKSIQERQQQGKPFDKSLEKFTQQLDKSTQRYEKRATSRPKITYDDALPIVARKDDLAAAIRGNQVVVVCGETGSGKSTQLPKICLEMGRGIGGMIGHTQPRRIAARSVASRIAEELDRPLGRDVGFKIRFTDTTKATSYIKLMTDGILLAETQKDRYLDQYDTIIIDEAHERSLNIDFLLGYIHRILPKRPDLRVIITSATIDAERFAEFFKTRPSRQDEEAKPAPVLEVSGRTYPVEVRYEPPSEQEGDDEVDWQRATADACMELAIEGDGDILVFMPTERDIRETARVLGGRNFPGPPTEILPLFGRLSEKEQNQVFKGHQGRRIVIATNVAESSITVPGIRYVVDPGTARISRFSATSKVQRLPIEPISQASANQRKGRCGRIGPGICVRLYSEQDFLGRDEYTQPEIQRTNLASVLLTMKSLKLGTIEDFPFIDPPAPTAIRSAVKSLFELGAIDEEENLTSTGRAMSKLPVDPTVARMIVGAADEQCLEEVLIIASALELRDPRERPLDKQKAADEAHAKFNHEDSDFLTYLKLWDFYAELDEKLSNSKLRKACQQNFLSFNRMREWRDLHRQLREIVIDRGFKPTDRRNKEESIHRAILTGLLSNIGMRGDGPEYQGAGGQKFFIWPGSILFDKKPKWFMAAELVETTKRFARCLAPIQPNWIERIAQHLVKHNYSDPHWHEKSAAPMAFEKVMLYGLPIVPRRRCRYGHVDPVLSRKLFIEHGLLQGEIKTSGEFLKHNTRLKEELQEWQAKLRQGSNFRGEEAEFNFYDDRVPPDVFDGPRFEKWRKQAEARHPRLLFLTKEDLLVDPNTAPHQTAFPDVLKVGTMDLPVEYNLDPGSKQDGVTLTVPREGLNQLSDDNLVWLVPGLLEEKIAALIKTLPKNLRILFVPIPETARKLVHTLRYGQGNLLEQLSAALRQLSGEYVPVDAFERERIPDHLRFNIRVTDMSGKKLAEGRDITHLKAVADSKAQDALSKINLSDDRWTRTGITRWDFGDLPEQVQLQRRGVTVVGFPMLVDQTKSVSLQLADTKLEAEWQTRRGLARLFWFSDHKRFTDQVKHFPRIDHLTVQASTLPDAKSFQLQLAYLMATECIQASSSIPRNQTAWNQRIHQARGHVQLIVQDLAELLEPLLEGFHEVRRLVSANHPPALMPVIDDLREQCNTLMAAGFLVQTPLAWLKQYPRYFEAMLYRWKKATTGGFQKDRQHQKLIAPHWQRYQQLIQKNPVAGKFHPAVVRYRWMIEEYRVSLFAQQMRTAVTVSEKKLNEAWKAIG